jgi:hypothetical protein
MFYVHLLVIHVVLQDLRFHWIYLQSLWLSNNMNAIYFRDTLTTLCTKFVGNSPKLLHCRDVCNRSLSSNTGNLLVVSDLHTEPHSTELMSVQPRSRNLHFQTIAILKQNMPIFWTSIGVNNLRNPIFIASAPPPSKLNKIGAPPLTAITHKHGAVTTPLSVRTMS